jgi:hypothetical protein
MRSDRAGPPDALAVPQQAVRHSRIIAEGFQNLRPDVVSPRPWSDRGSALSADANLNGSKRCVWASIAGR